MKVHTTTTTTNHMSKEPVRLVLISTFLVIIPLYCFLTSSRAPLQSSKISSSDGLRSIETFQECDIFSGKWIPESRGVYYTSKTCSRIVDNENCMKFGRTNTDFLKWRWKPEDCELPYLNAVQFLRLVRGKMMAFVGDSVGRNQMESLACILSRVAHSEDLSDKYSSNTDYFKRWYFPAYNFTLATLWSPFSVKSKNAGSMMNLYLDQPDEAWASQIENFDYVIISAGHWFFRPIMYYMNHQILGCSSCNDINMTKSSRFHGYKMAFRTTFKTLLGLENFKGITILRTFSPSHFENGEWNTGGYCSRTRPFENGEKLLDDFTFEFYLTQVEELRNAEKEGSKRGLKFMVLAITDAMLVRPDGHPNHFGNPLTRNLSFADCVHWCLPGPIDTWNEFLFYMLKREALKSIS